MLSVSGCSDKTSSSEPYELLRIPQDILNTVPDFLFFWMSGEIYHLSYSVCTSLTIQQEFSARTKSEISITH